MEILDIKDITGEELLKSTELLKNINKDAKSDKGDTWLFHKVWIFILKLILENINHLYTSCRIELNCCEYLNYIEIPSY